MSADNWRACPRCTRVAWEAKRAERKAADEAYGKVPIDAFEKLRTNAARDPKLEETLREDYQLGISEAGKFFVGYRASCQACEFEFHYEHEEAIES